MNYCIITTINPPTEAVKDWHKRFGDKLIIVGDKKTPNDWQYEDAKFIPFEASNGFNNYTPENHYARKNLGYLCAIRNGATLIYDSDDDNYPNENWRIRELKIECEAITDSRWVNIYKFVTKEFIWPRGFSLNYINDSLPIRRKTISDNPIQQGLADGSPDVDAIWRLVKNKEITFTIKRSVLLPPKTWCPFNSQSTWFFPDAFPLLYLPVNASFRMTDIWRSFVAQRCLWEMGYGVTFHSPAEVYQKRNEHDLLKDFEDEISGYLKNDLIVETLSALELKSGKKFTCENIVTCYQALVDKGVLPEAEIRSLIAWIKDYKEAAKQCSH